LAARAQQSAGKPSIGYPNPESRESRGDLIAAFRLGLAQIGYVEGQNGLIEYPARGESI
jgi:hypothetical protein